MSHTIWINSRTSDAPAVLAQNLRYLLENVNFFNKPLAFACIGSSRVMGDNLGPIIGTILSKKNYPYVYGTLDNPLNALTLSASLPQLNKLAENCCLIAIDASIGNCRQSGHLTLTDTCLHPGSALRRRLPAVGQIHITGVFNSLDSPSSRQLLPPLCKSIGHGLLDILTGLYD